MRFMITATPAKPGSDFEPAPMTEELFAAHMKYNEEMTKAGVLVTAEGLKPGGQEARLTIRNGKRVFVDGPYSESKEVLGGFYLIETKSLDEAIAWALKCPVGLGHLVEVEIHEMTEISSLPPQLQEKIRKVAPTWSASLWR